MLSESSSSLPSQREIYLSQVCSLGCAVHLGVTRGGPEPPRSASVRVPGALQPWPWARPERPSQGRGRRAGGEAGRLGKRSQRRRAWPLSARAPRGGRRRRARGDGGGAAGGAGLGLGLGLSCGPARMAGGAGWAGAPAALLRSVRRLREVFEVCGRDPDGFLRVERVAALGLRFGQGEEVSQGSAGAPIPRHPDPSAAAGPGGPLIELPEPSRPPPQPTSDQAATRHAASAGRAPPPSKPVGDSLALGLGEAELSESGWLGCRRWLLSLLPSPPCAKQKAVS